MQMQIAGFADPHELWSAALESPEPTKCAGTNANGQKCSFMAQGGLRYCKKHYSKYAEEPYPDPVFTHVPTTGIHVLHEGKRVSLGEAVMMLKIGKVLPLGHVLHRLRGKSDYPDDLQLVPQNVMLEARRSNHPEGEPILWKEEDGMPKYNPTSVRLPTELVQFLDEWAEKADLSRGKVLEHYLLQGIERGDPPHSVKTVVETAERPHTNGRARLG